jgi:tRNA A-37 threonylcarbamoyl transferase component Bud32
MKVPQLYKTDLEKYAIEMEFIHGVKLKDYLNSKELTQEGIN